jgi:hypothetical protein
MKTKTINQFAMILIVSCLFIQNKSRAECTYEQSPKADEFPIGIRLSWSTSFEHNTALFILEKLDNTQFFQAIGSLQASGSSKSIKEYTFLDNRAMSPTISYRIKQMDIDGTFSYSEIIVVHKKMEVNTMLVQQLDETVKNAYDFILESAKEGKVRLKLIDDNDNIAWEGTKELSKGLNNLSIDLTTQSEGIYKVIVLMERDEQVLTIRKSYDEVQGSSNVANTKKINRN